MDPLRFAIAVVPLAAWLAVLAIVNLRRRPFLTTGASDLVALGLGFSGLVFVGPVALFRPEPATIQFGNYIWPILMAFYLLWVMLGAMVMRPRIIVYNMTPEQLRPLVAESAKAIDPEFRWAADTLILPTHGVQLHFDGFRLLRNTSLVASGPRQNMQGWSLLAADLRTRVASCRAKPIYGAAAVMLATALVLVASSILAMTSDPSSVAEATNDIFAFAADEG